MRSKSANIKAPDTRRTEAKLAGSMLACCNARRHNTELAAKANIANAVSNTVRQGIEASFYSTTFTGCPGFKSPPE